ncbi:MAG: hypothetical protein ACLSVD_12870 [Eggerthellaceae bacterium]
MQVAYAIGVARPVSLMVRRSAPRRRRWGHRAAVARCSTCAPASSSRAGCCPIYRKTAATATAASCSHLGAHRPCRDPRKTCG